MIHGNRANIDKFGQIIFIWNLAVIREAEEIYLGGTYIVSVPGHHIKRRMSLSTFKELPSQFVHDLPSFFLDFELGFRREEITWVGKAIGTKGSQFRQIEVRTPYFKNITPGRPIWEFNAESLTSHDNADFSRLNVERPKFRLDVETSLLGNNQEVTIGVDEGFLLHTFVGRIDVSCNTFTKSGVT